MSPAESKMSSKSMLITRFPSGMSAYQLSDVDHISAVCTSVGMLLTLSVNLFGGGIISIRLMMYRNRMVHLLGKHHGALYTNIAIIVLESALLFVIVEIFFFATFFLESPPFNLASELISPLQVSTMISSAYLFGPYLMIPPFILRLCQTICSFLVIYRIMLGRSVSTAPVSTAVSKDIEFA